MTRIFIDGKAGTTGLKIFSRFQNRPELELIQIDEDKRKDPAERAKCINDSDITFLCLPDPAAIGSHFTIFATIHPIKIRAANQRAVTPAFPRMKFRTAYNPLSA